jgi:outer membrane immunogenic protein
MKRAFLFVSLLSGLGLGTALAADLPVYVKTPAPQVAAPIFDWTGFYVGGHAGYGWAKKSWRWEDFDTPPTVFVGAGSHSANGFLGGGQIGFNVQHGSTVFGVEVQASWSDLDANHVTPPIPFQVRLHTEINFLASAAARLGYSNGPSLWYLKGGAAYVREKFGLSDVPSGPVAWDSQNRWGWVVGAGYEYAFSNNWSGKLEYSYMDFRRKSSTFPVELDLSRWDVGQKVHSVMMGINYRFAVGQ